MHEHPRSIRLPSSDQIKEILAGRRAVVGYTDSDPEVGEHALAWKDNHAIDCSNGEIVLLEEVTVNFALILTPLTSVPSL